MLIHSLLFAAFAAAAPGSVPVVHEKRQASRNVGRAERVDRNAILPVRIALKQSNLNDGYDHLMEVSDPYSPNYGKHWTIEEIHAKFAPSEETIEAVKAWLVASGIGRDDISESASRGWLGVDISAADAERLFQTEYFENNDSHGNTDVGCDLYHVPSHLAHHIDYVTPGIAVSSFEKKTLVRRNELQSEIEKRAAGPAESLEHCDARITPACIKALYDVPDASLNVPNALGIFEDYSSLYDQRDLNLWFERFTPNIPLNTHPELVSINGDKAPTSVKNADGESILDLDLAFSLTYPQTITLFQSRPTFGQRKAWRAEVPGPNANKQDFVGSRALFEDLLDAVDGAFCTPTDKASGADCGTIELTNVISTSYGAAELFLPESLLKRSCSEYMKLGLKGHTILFSSGDYGPGQVTGCVDPEHIDEPLLYNGTVFNPYWPSACPYITSVGGTQLNHGETVDDPETVMYKPAVGDGNFPYAIFGSAGGFSNYFPMPGYQKSAVNHYLSNYNPGYPSYVFTGKDSVGAGGGIYAKGGRGMPDVAANGANLLVYVNGGLGTYYGTSLASPIWAGLVTLINNERHKAGKGPVGFINPVLYAHPEAFNDITTGHAAGCLTEGFSAEPGWDPTTGLGTPNYPDLLAVFMSLP